MKYEWPMPQRTIFGAGSIKSMPKLLEDMNAEKALLVVGANSMKKSGAIGKVAALLSGKELVIHEGVPVNLPIQAADELADVVREVKPDVVIGMGGGSVLDGAKLAAWIGPDGGKTAEYLDGRRAKKGVPFISVPTTSGTGSEVTPYIILMDTEKKVKLSLGSPLATPVVAIVDPELTLSLPPDQTASTGLDALSHGLEAYWAKAANPMSDALALEAVQAVLANLVRAYDDPQDLEARTGMSHAACVAGMALNHTATAAVHGLTYPLTARHGVPHGIACAFLMREVFAINFHHLELDRQKKLLYAMKSNTLGAALDLLTDLYEKLGVPGTLADLGIDPSEIDVFARECTAKNMERNAAEIPHERIVEIWQGKIG